MCSPLIQLTWQGPQPETFLAETTVEKRRNAPCFFLSLIWGGEGDIIFPPVLSKICSPLIQPGQVHRQKTIFAETIEEKKEEDDDEEV